MIFLINGKARSGKDTIADYIVKTTGAKKLWFAKPLKDMCIKYFNLTEDECYDNKSEFSRRVLQAVGQMFRDEFSKSFWVDKVSEQLKDLNSNGFKHFVISDCRYKNEIIELCSTFDYDKYSDIIRCMDKDVFEKYKLEYYDNNRVNKDTSLDFLLPKIRCSTIKIERGNCPNIEYGADHSSENDLNNFNFDHLIKNNGTLKELYKMVDILLLDNL